MTSGARNIALYPWFKFAQNLVFWQAIWFLYFQNTLSGAEAIILYACYDIATTVLEVPSGYFSDRIGRRFTLILAALSSVVACALVTLGDSFTMFVLAQVAFGAGSAFSSGTDTSLLYESLAAEDKEAEVEYHELRAWRFGFSALGISAFLGGAMALWALVLPFAVSGIAALALLAVTLQFRTPDAKQETNVSFGDLSTLKVALLNPVLGWLFALFLVMYAYSHLPFVFGQPFILAALSDINLSAQAPLISGTVTALMMLLSVAVSLIAQPLRDRMGLVGILLFAFGIQIALAGALALTASVFAIGLLLLRMVPNALSRPFIMARIQPMLSDDTRATYLSIQNLAGRVVLFVSLLFAAGYTTAVGEMPIVDIQKILGWYAVCGIGCLAALALVARRLPIAPSA